MAFTKVSLSLEAADVAFLDSQTSEGRFASRSAAAQEAVRLLRESRLADAYAEAFVEWRQSDDDVAWSSSVGDGLA